MALPNDRGRDRHAVHAIDGRDHLDGEAARLPEPAQHLDIAGAPAPKAVVVADHENACT